MLKQISCKDLRPMKDTIFFVIPRFLMECCCCFVFLLRCLLQVVSYSTDTLLWCSFHSRKLIIFHLLGHQESFQRISGGRGKAFSKCQKPQWTCRKRSLSFKFSGVWGPVSYQCFLWEEIGFISQTTSIRCSMFKPVNKNIILEAQLWWWY